MMRRDRHRARTVPFRWRCTRAQRGGFGLVPSRLLPSRAVRCGLLAGLPLVLLACGPASGGGEPDPKPFEAPEPPANGSQLHIDRFTLEPFEEIERCRFMKAPNTEAGHITRIELRARTGLHHAFIAKVDKDFDDATVPCFGFPDEVMQGLSIPEPIYASSTQVPSETIVFPEGVGVELGPGQQLVIDYHYLNTRPEPIEAEIYMNLYFADPAEQVETAQVYVFGNMGGIEIPAQGTQSLTTTCTFESEVNLVTVTPHMHALGRHFLVRAFDGSTAGELLYETKTWDNPSTRLFDPPRRMEAGEGLTFTCEWANDTDRTVRFGQTSEDEMCFVFGYVYPAAEPILRLDLNDGCVTESAGP